MREGRVGTSRRRERGGEGGKGKAEYVSSEGGNESFRNEEDLKEGGKEGGREGNMSHYQPVLPAAATRDALPPSLLPPPSLPHSL